MAQVNGSKAYVKVDTRVILELSYHEAAALEAIFGYDVNIFLKVFYERMGKAYVQPHEEGVRSLHNTIRSVLAGPIQEVQDLRNKISAALRQ